MDTSHASMHNLERWDDLRYFLACAELGSFSKAAHHLRVEQSTVSRRIWALERALEGTLFTRTPEGVRMTALAECVYQEAKATEHHIATLFAQARGENEEVAGLVRIAVTDGMAQHFLLPSLPALMAQFPNLRFTLMVDAHPSDLVRGEADLALRFFRPHQGDLVSKQVALLHQQVLAHPRYWDKHKDLPWEQQRWLALEIPSLPTPESSWFQRHISAAPCLQTNNYTTLMAAVQEGLGLALLLSSVQRVYPELLAIPTPFSLPEPFALWLVAHAAQRHTPRIARVWAFLESLCTDLLRTSS